MSDKRNALGAGALYSSGSISDRKEETMSKDGWGLGPAYDPSDEPHEPQPPVKEWSVVLKIATIGEPRRVIQKRVEPSPPFLPNVGEPWEAFPHSSVPDRTVQRRHFRANNTVDVWLVPHATDDFEKLEDLARGPQGWEVVN